MIQPKQLAELFDQHADRLLLIARSFSSGSSNGWAEDAVQEAFIAIAAEKSMPDDPVAWLVRVTRNQLLQWHRGQGRRRQREHAKAGTNWFNRSSAIDDRLDGTVVTESLQRMPSPDREIIVMHLWGEMTFEQIAEVVGGSHASAHRKFVAGLKRLQQEFNPAAINNNCEQTQREK